MTKPGLPPAGILDHFSPPPPPLSENAISPTLERPTPLPTANVADPLAAVLQQPLPSASRLPDVLTPGSETLPAPSMDTIVGARIAPLADSLPPPSNLSVKTSGSLRLPSFEALGIANPHSTNTIPSRPLAQATQSSDALNSPVRLSSHLFETLTPPEDKLGSLWLSGSSLSAAMASSGNERQPRSALATGSMTPVSLASEGATAAPRDHLQRSMSETSTTFWIQDVANEMVTTVLTSHETGDSIKIMSQALPCPSPSGFVFPRIIRALQDRTAGKMCWVNVFHALPGKFGLNDVPTSPPATPDPPVTETGKDYFTSMIFDSAVRVLDYQDNVTRMPKSPHPLVPPGTMSLSIVERYIPPTSRNEFVGIFNLGGRSLLIDRLVELCIDSGSLLLIYPTKTGAETFTRQYLGPVLDPLLRSMLTIHHLPVDLATSLGKMSAVEHMLEFDELHEKLKSLCEHLSSDDPRVSRYANTRSRFLIDRFDTHKVVPDRAIWASAWWAKQEKARIRDTVKRYARVAFQPADGLHIAPTAIVENVLEGVASRPYPSGSAPSDGIEVGVFVIRRVAA